jgi:hypothetical protein
MALFGNLMMMMTHHTAGAAINACGMHLQPRLPFAATAVHAGVRCPCVLSPLKCCCFHITHHALLGFKLSESAHA